MRIVFFFFYRQWRNLDGEQQKYLIQISPPADIIPEIVRSIVVAQNITNAGIMFDDTFGKTVYLKFLDNRNTYKYNENHLRIYDFKIVITIMLTILY